ncbi:hypothetical protein L5515_003784 [Caenorhabditis briggsae]|uniref:Glutaredoxin-like protein n=1 Tax=Caenorhabditis briggsae TaxID=6238 RepID=A0AAE9DB74_CAEBR|nr:hypothetical protein L3Y34_000927 [Caenorhabditis briggsae]UMM22692.1 hypothetical protein L5515_003784 [Caenorhabditis briggsae]
MITFPRALQRSFSSKPVELVLFSSENCSLCIHFHRQLQHYLKKHPNFAIIEKNLAAETPEVIERFKYDIPVLVDANNKVILKHRFSGALLEENLSKCN